MKCPWCGVQPLGMSQHLRVCDKNLDRLLAEAVMPAFNKLFATTEKKENS